MRIETTRTKAAVAVENLAPVCWLAMGIETGALWWFGRGMFRVRIERRAIWNLNDEILVNISPLSAWQVRTPLVWSNITPVGQIKEMPAQLVHPWNKDDINPEHTLIQITGLSPETPIGVLAYGLADATCEFFKYGALIVSAQYSIGTCQILADVGLEDAQITKLANPSSTSYSPGDHVGALPWPK